MGTDFLVLFFFQNIQILVFIKLQLQLVNILVVSAKRGHIIMLFHIGILRVQNGDGDIGAVGGDALEVVQQIVENEAQLKGANIFFLR